MRLAYYAGASTAAAAACLLKAFHQRPNFYSATVYLSQSNACLLILTNLLLVLACSFMFALQRLLYGPLRPIEIEQLSEKAWYAVLDTLLAMPSFREDVGGWLLTMFVLLLAGKVWGWIAEGRVDVFEQQPPANPRLFHTRLATSLTVSVLFDALMLKYCIETIIADPRPGMMVIFTFEFGILFVFSTFTFCRYLLGCWEARIVKQQTKLAIEIRKLEIRAERAAAYAAAVAAAAENTTEDGTPAPVPAMDDSPIDVDENEVDVPGWEEKRRYLFGLEVMTDFIKLMVYIVFFTVSITFNGLPMHIMRDVYMTFASFSKRVGDYVAYRKATSDMNTRYPDATTEEIRGDACIVCREDMVSWEQPNAGAEAQPAGDQPAAAPAPARRRDERLRAKKLPCGHILHLHCLKAWLERQQVCPTCRRPVVTATASNAPAGPRNPPAPGQAGQPGQPGQQQPPGPRARIFNLGPLRVGLLNAPQGQIQDFINRFQNPDAANQNAAGANQQGPNHLGLQVPYANGQAETSSGTRRTGRRSQVPIDVQIMQMEQRLMQEAHNLGVDQQQLATLRTMEGEMARLRAQRIPIQPPMGTNGVARHAADAPQQMARFPMPGFMPIHQPFMPQVAPEALQGSPARQMSPGHEGLPQGLVLPEGWTLMPLHRVGSDQNAAQGTPAGVAPWDASPSGRIHPSIAARGVGSTSDTAAARTEPAPATSQAPTQNTQNAGPADDNGSPLFVPTATNTTDATTDEMPTATIEQRQTQPAPQTVPPVTTTVPSPSMQEQTRPPWESSSWGFDDQSGATTSATAPEASASSSSHAPEQSAQEGYSGKGKARAVEVEEVPEPEAGH
ncbi:hypothetical protein DOTSEDRAFT_74980 [Dothistroma septosporum NZE10]|uniref:RING-type E3 ubiquitin transferase n=1 Tax=Dothistroma septosporum (strain NZE10 / CBS 128990) TaxID=675120 RepID=N1PDC1_DOTSN|nr:hypothetical protein DOTSEDRAFT_74980 [Dothistroma septosporum NZE10]